MKIILTKAEVERIVLETLAKQFPGVPMNSIEVSNSIYRDEFCVITYEAPPEPAKVEA